MRTNLKAQGDMKALQVLLESDEEEYTHGSQNR